jgi:hypothetical protein
VHQEATVNKHACEEATAQLQHANAVTEVMKKTIHALEEQLKGLRNTFCETVLGDMTDAEKTIPMIRTDAEKLERARVLIEQREQPLGLGDVSRLVDKMDLARRPGEAQELAKLNCLLKRDSERAM